MLRLLRYKPSPHLPYSTATAVAAAAPSPHPQCAPPVTDPTLTLYFLQKSCKLSPAAATAVAQEINLKSTKRPHAILALLRDYGFSETHIVRLISSRPKLLLACPSSTIKPKLDFYASVGLSVDDFTDHFCTRERLFLTSIKNRFAPNLLLLRHLYPSHEDLLAAVRRYPAVILSDLQKIVPVKTDALLDTGLTTDTIAKLIALYPRCFRQSPSEFTSSLAALKEMGLSASSPSFVHAFKVISRLPDLMRESRMQSLERLGWSRDQILAAFAKHPYCLSSSGDRVGRNVKFFTEKLGWGPDKLSGTPVLISLSFEKRIAPRYRMFRILDERGLLKGGITFWHFLMAEKKFMKLFVHKHQDPEILEALSRHSSDLEGD